MENNVSSLDAIDFIKTHNSFVIIPHTRPDGDAIGSAVSLREGLKLLGKQAQILLPSPVSDQLKFLNNDLVLYHEGIQLQPFDAIFVVDTCSWVQLGVCADWFKNQNVPKFVIDHHATFDDLGAKQFVTTKASACCQMIYWILDQLFEPIPANIANSLFTGIALDTGWFKHDNTTPEVLDAASYLVYCGAEPSVLYRNLFRTSTLHKAKLNGYVLNNLVVDNNICYVVVPNSVLESLGATPKDADSLVSHTMSIEGVDTGILLIEEKPYFYKVSLRSDVINCSKIAKSLNGGGHTKAAGLTFYGSELECLNTILKLVKEERNVHSIST